MILGSKSGFWKEKTEATRIFLSLLRLRNNQKVQHLSGEGIRGSVPTKTAS